MPTNLLEIRDLQVQRGGKPVLHIPALNIPKGQVTAILGPNGSGKSTLLLSVARLLRPSSGEVLFNGQAAHHETDTSFRRRIGLVLQSPLLLDSSVFDNVITGLRFRGMPQAEMTHRAGAWLAKLGIAHLRERRATNLSGGEAQRVSLARAFVLEPELLLLDEPFSGLDAPTRVRLLADLHTLLEETRTTTLFVTHDMAEAQQLAARVAILLGGRLRQVGEARQVFNHPADPQVAELLGRAT
jgi:tungstate transport system ATP-binding protein